MIIHIPHSSKMLPHLPNLALSEHELNKEIERITDHKTDILFAHKNAIVFPYSRLFCDVERLIDDEMGQIGMGISYNRTSNGKEIYANKPIEVVDNSMKCYREHHKRFEKMVEHELESLGSCLIIDAHSFPKEHLGYEKDGNRPDICIGTNEWDTGIVEIAAFTEDYFREKGYTVYQNSPYFGSMIPEKYKYDKRVSSMMIEVNRGLYMDEDFNKVYEDIQQLLSELERRQLCTEN